MLHGGEWMRVKRLKRFWRAAWMSSGLVACGGGDGSARGTALGGGSGHVPTADIAVRGTGPFLGGEAIWLDGPTRTDPGDTRLSYTWRQLSGPLVSLGNPHNASLVIAAPNDPSTLVFELEVFDGSGSSKAEVEVAVEAYEGEPASFAPNPFMYSFGVVATDTALQEDLLFAAMEREGVAIFDVSTPSAPKRLATYQANDFEPWQVAVHGNVLLAAGGSYPATVHLVDVSAPEAPRKLSEFTVPFVRDASLSASHAYLATDWPSPFEIHDVSDPTAPREVVFSSEPQLPGDPTTLTVEGDRAFLGVGSAVKIIDTTDKANPKVLGTLPVSIEALSVAVKDNLVFVAAGVQGVIVFDATDPSAPKQLFAPDGEGEDALQLQLEDDLLYVATGSSGLSVYDITDPKNLRRTGQYAVPDRLVQVSVHGTYAILAMQDSLQSLALGDTPSLYTLPAWLPTASGIEQLTLTGTSVWAVVKEHELWRLDLKDAADTPQSGETASVGPARAATADESRLYLAPGGGVPVLSLESAQKVPAENSDTLDPISVFEDHTLSINALLARNGLLYLCESNLVEVADMHDPEAPSLLGGISVPAPTYAIDVLGDLGAVAGGGAVHILNLKDPAQPELTGSYTFEYPDDANAYDVAIHGQVVIVADGYDGPSSEGSVRVLDISEPAAPRLRGQLERATVAVALAGPYAYMPEKFPPQYHRDPVPLVSIVDITDPDTPRVAGRLPLRGSPSDVAVNGSDLVVASDLGISVLPLAPQLSPLRAAASPGEEITYQVHWDRLPVPHPAVKCVVTSGRCVVEGATTEDATLRWTPEAGDQEIAVIVGDGHAFFSARDRLHVR